MAHSYSLNDEADALGELLRRCARREATALEALYRRSAPRLLGCLVKILRRPALAEEVLQEVYLQVWERAAQFEPHRGSPMAWMLSIARHRAIDTLRRERPGLLQSLDEAGGTEGLAARAPELGVHPDHAPMRTHREEEALALCLQQLDAAPRECIELAFLRGLSHSEVAAERQLPLGTTKSWIRRGLLTLRECIDACMHRRPT